MARRSVLLVRRLCFFLSLAAAFCGGCHGLRCGKSRLVKKTDTCKTLTAEYKISLSLFRVLNPGVVCSALPVGKMVCVLPVNRKLSVTHVPILSSSATLKPRFVSSLLTWQPFWAARQTNDSDSAAGETPSVPFRTCGGTAESRIVTHVTPRFLGAAESAGLAILSDGRQFRYARGNCWVEKKSQRILQPFVSVAACSFSVGTRLFVSELHGRKTTNDKMHNGCVRVDDTCEEADVAALAHFLGAEAPSPDWREGGARVHVREAPACVILDYS